MFRVQFREKLIWASVCSVLSEKYMDIKTLLHNLREEVSCPVCTNVYTDPKHLPCLHTFCLQCLKHWHKQAMAETQSDARSVKLLVECPKVAI